MNFNKIYTVIWLSFILNGCSVFKPYVDPPLIPSPENWDTSAMPLLEQAIQELQTKQIEPYNGIRWLRDETHYYRSGFGVLAFGLAAATGITGVFGASRDLILALGLGAAGSYTGSTLFFSKTKTRLYNAADTALRQLSR